MTLGEKVSQMVHEARGISRLGIPAVGGQQPDERSEELSGKTVLNKDIFYIPDHQSDHGIKEI